MTTNSKQSAINKHAFKPLALAIFMAIAGSAQAQTFSVNNTNDSGDGSLRKAISDANAAAGEDTILFSGITQETITLTSGALSITDDLIISGSIAGDASSIVISGNNSGRIIDSRGASLTLENLTLRDAKSIVVGAKNVAQIIERGEPGPKKTKGGAITFDYTSSVAKKSKLQAAPAPSVNFNLNHTLITGNSSANSGGGIYVRINDGEISINDSIISGNSSSGRGGGAYLRSNDGNISINKSKIINNNTTEKYGRNGGAFIRSFNGDLSVTDSIISGNSTNDNIGGMSLSSYYGAITVTRSTVSDNTAGSGIGGMSLSSYEGDIKIVDSTISGNTAQSETGGLKIYSYYGNTLINQSTISGNTAKSHAALFIDSGFYIASTTINNSTITNNTATDKSGGITALSTVTLINSILSGNNAPENKNFSYQTERIIRLRPAPLNNRFAKLRKAHKNIKAAAPAPVTVTINLSNTLFGDPKASIAAILGTDIDNIFNPDPKLGPLQNNGGPTLTHQPLAGSPAIDAGDDAAVAGVAFDQRGEGFTRVYGAKVDIGALEKQPHAGQPIPILSLPGLFALLAGLFGFGRWRSRVVKPK